MMREPRRRSPESARRRRRDRRDSREQLTDVPPMAMPQGSYTDFPPPPATATTTADRGGPRARPRAPSSTRSSSSSLSSSSLLDISRHYPYRSRFGGVLGTFFRAPSERSRRRRERRRSGGTRKRRILYFANSSSSSVNSDLAYGNGYINRPKSRNLSPRGTTAASAAGQSHQQHPQQYRGAGYTTDGSNRPGTRRPKTDQEILELGRQLSDFARKQNEHDLRAAGRSRPTGLMAAAATVSGLRQRKRHGAASRGIGSSRPHRGSSGDESDWESASDGESSDGADSELAYGSVVSHALRPAMSAAAGAAAGAAIASTVGGPSTQTRQASVVDPRLFGPVNSLHGLITPRPFGDDESAVPAVQYQNFNRLRRAETEPVYKKDVYPAPTPDLRKLDADTASMSSLRRDLPHRSRPASVPLQQPVPKAPVSAKVYQAEKLEDVTHRDSRHSRQRSDEEGFGGATLAGVAAAAAAAAALAADRKKRRDERRDERKDDRKDDKTDDGKKDRRESRDHRDPRDDERRDRDRRSEKPDKSERDSKRRDRESDRDRERRKSKRDSYSSKYPDDKEDNKRSSRREDQDTPRKRRETFVDHHPEQETRKYRNGEIEVQVGPEVRSEVSKSSRRDSRKYDDRDEQRDARKGEKAGSERAVDTTVPPPERAPIDPFQYQIGDNALMAAPQTAPERPLTPQVVTVDRVPNFDDSPPRASKSDTRLSRRESFEMEREAEDYKKGPRGAPRSAEPRRRHSYEEEEHEAKGIYDEAMHATIPVAAAAVASAIAVEASRSRDHQREEYSDDGSRERRRDAVLEEANRHYREAAIARKIAGDQVRSRSQTPDRSVVDKWDEDITNETTTIVTPPELDDQYHDRAKNLYGEPDADVRIDNKIYPKEIHRFRANGGGLDAPVFKSRDPSCERDRPLLNLVYPTPMSSRHATPSPESLRRSAETREGSEPSSQAESSEVAIGPSTAKSVTWGENSTKRFEVVTPEPRSDTEGILDRVESGDTPRPRLNNSSQWGIIAAAIAGSSAEPANEPEARDSRNSPESSPRNIAATGPDQVFTYDASDVPPVPGPKPASPRPGQMPGSFGDDIEFAATLAAGLKDTGFDPNIVIDDPTYRRRDSPPGSSEPNGDSWNRKSFSDIVTDLSSAPGERSMPQPGYVVGEVETPRDEHAAATDEWAEVPAKLSKKDKKRLEKLQRQSGEVSEPVLMESPEAISFEDAAEAPQKLTKKEQKKRDKEARAQALMRDDEQPLVVESEPSASREAGDDWDDDGRKKSKKNRKSRDLEEDAASKVSVPTDAFEDLQSLRKVEPDDEWDAPKKSKKKSKRDSGAYESPSRSAAPSEVSVESSSKRSSKSKRRSGIDDDFDEYGGDPPGRRKADPFEDREVSSVVSEARYDERRREKRESRRSSRHDDDDTKSVASAPGGSREKRESRQSSRYDDDNDTKSAASAPGGSREKRETKRSSRYDDDDARSVASAPGGSREKRESRRSSRYDDDDARSVASAPGGSRKSKDPKDSEKRSSGLFSSIFKSSGKDEKKDSFLDNAGTPGAGVGLATVAAAAAVAAGLARSNATEDSSDKERDSHDAAERPREVEIVDPEIAPRAIKPAIDPQYGDLLPLPPSEPGTPKDAPEELPGLPDSRPDTPPEERNWKRDYFAHRRRRSTQETPVKSPSSTAIPISLRLGQRGAPTTPGSSTFKSPPMGSPVGTPDSVSRRQARHISWDSSREIKPLYLLEHSRHHSTDNFPLGTDLPALPPSEPPSRESPAPGFEDVEIGDVFHRGLGADGFADSGLRIDTSLAQAALDCDLGGSQETTPKAEARPELPPLPALGDDDDQQNKYVEPDPVEPMSKDRSSYLLYSTPSSIRSNKTADSEGVAQSPRGSTPSKKLGAQDLLHDITEDLTSADEHFSDAMEGPSEDAFEEARDWPVDPIAPEQLSCEPPSQEVLPETVTLASTEDNEPDEWSTMSAKEKKKAKKARKNKGLDLAEAAVAAAAVGAAATVAASALTEDAPKDQDASASQPGQPLDVFEQPKKGKKGKKNKRQSLSWGDDLAATSTQPSADEDLTVAHTEVPDATLSKDEPLTFEPELVSSTSKDDTAPFIVPDESTEEIAAPQIVDAVKEVDTTLTTDPTPDSSHEIAPEPPAEEETWEAPSKKSKKKKKKGKEVTSWDDTPAPESELQVQPEAIVADESGGIGQVEALWPASEPPVSAEPQELKDEPEATNTPAEAAEPNADDMWSTPASSKKDKKPRKKGKQAAFEWNEVPALKDEPQTLVEPGVADESRDLSPEETLDSTNETPVTAEADVTKDEPDAAVPVPEPSTAVDPDNMWTTPAASKKDKKKKKKAKEVMAWDEPQAPETGPVAQEEAIIADEPRDISQDEPATPVSAAEPLTVVDPEDMWSTPATSKKDKKKKKKAKEVMAWDEPPAHETEPAAQEEAIIADEPRDVSQEEPAATTEAAEAKEDPMTLVPAPELSTVADPEDTWSTPATSKKDKKKKKTKSLQLDEPLPAEDGTDAPPVPEEPAVEAKDPDLPADTEPQPFTEPPFTQPTSAAAEPEFAPVSKGKKKKKDKRKSVQWGPEEPDTTLRPEQDTADRSLDVAAEDPVLFQPSGDQSHHHSASSLLPAAALGAAGSALIAALDHDKTDKQDPVEQYDRRDIAISDELETAKAEEIPEEDNKQVSGQDADRSRALESHISEPLFSQGDAPVEPTQEATSLEPTQVDEPASEATFDDFDAPKKKGKKKKSQASVWDLIEDEPIQKQETDPEASNADLAVETPAEEPAIAALDETSKVIPQEQSLNETREAEAEDEWTMPTSGKKSKKNKKKGSKSPPAAEQEPVVEAPAETTEPVVFTEEPASIEEPSATVTTGLPAQDSATVDEWPQATGKKGKKKKRQSQMSSTWDDEPATTAPSIDASRQAETDAPTVDTQAESEVPKKGKKGKKKKNTFSWESPDAEPPQDAASKSQEPLQLEELAATESEMLPQSEDVPTVDDAPASQEDNETKTVSGVEQGSDVPNDETKPECSSETLALEAPRELDAPKPTTTDAPPAEDSEPLFPVKVSKKDKKKKKKQTWLDEDVPSAEGTPRSATPEEGSAVPGETGTKPPPGTSEQQPEATPDDEWGGFSLKKPKKDKKKKAKDVESENPQEPEIASPPVLQPEKTDTAADQTTKASPNDNERGAEAPLDRPEPVPVTEPEILGQAGPTEDPPISEELEKREEGDWSLGLSKKDKKKKKKAKTLEAEIAESSPPSQETTIPQEKDSVEDDVWSGAVSKKDKKKKKKAKPDSQDDFLAELTAPAEDPMNIQDSPTAVEAEQEAAVDTEAPPDALQDLEMKDAPSHDASGTTDEQQTADLVENELKDISAAEPKESEGRREQEQVDTGVATDDSKHGQDSPAERSIDAEASNPKDPNPEDEWSVPLTGKKGKKGKKNRRSQVEAFAWEEPAAEGVVEAVEPSSETPSVPAEEPTQEPPLAETDMAEPTESTAPVPASEDIEMRDAGQNVEAKEPEASDQQADSTKTEDEPTSRTQGQENASSEDTWEAMPQRKPSKKDKKKKKRQESSTEDPVEPAIEAPTRLESTSTSGPTEADSSTVPEDRHETPVFAQEISQEPEEWLPTKKSKKDKKTKKLALAMADLAVAGLAADSITAEKDETREPPATEELPQPEPVSSWADEMEEAAPIVQPVNIPREPEPVQEDDGFAFQMPTNKKKGKKGKASLGAAEPSSESGPTSEPEPPAEHAAAEPRHAESGGEVARDLHATEPELTSHAPDVPETTAADDTWAMSIKKKGKKGKKGMGSGTMTPANEPEVFVQPQPESTEPTSDLAEEARSFEPAMGPVPEPVPEPVSEPLPEHLHEPEAPKHGEPEETPQAAEDNDAWQFTTKKTKKGKKGKKGSGTMTPANEPDVAAPPGSTEPTRDVVEETPMSSFEPTTEPASQPGEPEEPKPAEAEDTPQPAEPQETPQPPEDNDTWAFTTKKSKKGKKGKKGSGVVTPANEPEPQVESEPAEFPREVATKIRDIEPAVETVVAQEAPELQAPQELPPVVESTADDAWEFTTKKKGKKGKKGKSGSGTMTPTTGLEDQPVAVDAPPTEDKDDKPPMTEAAATVDSESPRATWIQEPTPPVEAEGEWAMPTKKKKGKGKKSKGIPLSAFDEPTTQPEGESVELELPQEPGSTDDQLGEPIRRDLGERQPEELTVTPDDNTEISGDAMEVEKPVDFTDGPKSAQPEPMAMDEAPAPADANPDDAWGTPVKKKSKKDKKRKSSQVMVLDSPPSDPPALEETAAISSLEQDQDTPMADDADQEQPADDDWFDDFSVPKASSSVSKTKKKKKKKSVELPARAPATSLAPQTVEAREAPVETAIPEPAQGQVEEIAEVPNTEEPTYAGADAFDDVWESDPRLLGKGGMDLDAPASTGADAFDDVWESDPRLPGKGGMDLDAPASTGADAFDDVWESDPRLPGKGGMDLDAPASTGADAFDDVWESDPRLPGKRLDQNESSAEKEIGQSKEGEGKPRESSGPSTAGTTAAAAAVTGGVALLAERFGGGKKKKKGKQKKILDKRQRQEEDIFDDPALWESADKKSLQAEGKAEVTASTGEDVWGGGDEKAEPSKAKEAPAMLMSESFTESEGGWKETARQGAPLDDDFTESPVLGRDETALVRSEPAGLLRLGSEVGEPVGGLLREKRDGPAMAGSLSPAASEFRRSPARALPAVEEVPEAEAAEAAEAAKHNWPTPETNRDSGFAADSPNPQRPRSILFSDEPQRDSGVHTGEGDWAEGAPRTPEPPAERKLQRSPFGTPVLREGTPVLREPAAAGATPEPEKRAGQKKKGYGELAAATALGAGGAAAGGAAAAAASRQHYDDQDGSAGDGRQHRQHRQPLRAEPGPLAPRRSASNTSLSTSLSPRFRPESPGTSAAINTITRPAPTPTPTPPLRRVDRRVSGDLRALRLQSSAAAPSPTHDRDKDRQSSPSLVSGSASSPPPPPVANERRARAARDNTQPDNDMADVYDGFGEGRIGSPRSPTRPHSMRRRQSMQVLELESRVEQLIAENRLLADARAHAEQNLTQRAATVLSDRDAEIEALRQSLQFLQNEVARLSEVNEGLASANAELASKDSRQLGEARGAHSAVNLTLEQKDAEIADLRAQLDAAKEQIRAMQRQILDSKAGDSDFLTIHDEDYFDNRCRQLCSHVQQWVLRFSKFSDMRACRLTSEINDEKTIDRLDNAVLDGSDVDTYLNDRVRRRDIFMSMTMNMVWEFVFTRYLFGMDREQRQKLKSLEKLLTDVGPPQAVRQWRAVTLTLLSKRDSFRDQRELDTEAVVQAVFQTLCKILPPPGNLEGQIQSQLRRVMREAVDLSIEMRTQRAEYMMLPPLQPEYDADGELATTVQFDASMMNERSGGVSLTNEELESQGAVVRVVLFPLVVKRGDDSGVGEDKIVVCPAQVLIARDKGRRHVTPSSDAGGASLGAPSRISLVTETMGQPDAGYLEDDI